MPPQISSCAGQSSLASWAIGAGVSHGDNVVMTSYFDVITVMCDVMNSTFSDGVWGERERSIACQLTVSLPRMMSYEFSLQPHQKYNITQYEELDFS